MEGEWESEMEYSAAATCDLLFTFNSLSDLKNKRTATATATATKSL